MLEQIHRRSPCGERGLKWLCQGRRGAREGRRSPCGERGLKSPFGGDAVHDAGASLPVRGAWVEMQWKTSCPWSWFSRSPCGERWLKLHGCNR